MTIFKAFLVFYRNEHHDRIAAATKHFLVFKHMGITRTRVINYCRTKRTRIKGTSARSEICDGCVTIIFF